MENLTQSQELRHNLLERTNYNIEAAKECFEFIMGNDRTPIGFKYGQNGKPIKVVDINIPIPSPKLPDGIYLVTTSGEAIAYADVDTTTLTSHTFKGVGVVEGKKSLIVALTDACSNETRLTTSDGGFMSIPEFHDAVTDWNGEANTKDIADILHSDIKLKEGEFIPSLGQLYFMMLHFNGINAALNAIDGDPLLDDWYWSSTQSSSVYAWILGLGYGYAHGSTMATYERRVRPVSAF